MKVKVKTRYIEIIKTVEKRRILKDKCSTKTVHHTLSKDFEIPDIAVRQGTHIEIRPFRVPQEFTAMAYTDKNCASVWLKESNLKYTEKVKDMMGVVVLQDLLDAGWTKEEF